MLCTTKIFRSIGSLSPANHSWLSGWLWALNSISLFLWYLFVVFSSINCLLARYSVGQNLGNGYISWAACIQDWFDEIKDFKYNSSETESNYLKVGHFTQVRLINCMGHGCLVPALRIGKMDHLRLCPFTRAFWIYLYFAQSQFILIINYVSHPDNHLIWSKFFLFWGGMVNIYSCWMWICIL